MKIDWSVWRERIWIAGSAVVFFLANFAFFLGSRAVDASREAALKKNLAAARERFAEGQRQENKAESEQGHIENVRRAAQEFYGRKIGTVDETMASTVAEIHSVCRRAGVAPHAISYAVKAVPKIPLLEMKVSFKVDGNYGTLRRLLKEFEQDRRWLVVKQVELARQEETVGEGSVQLDIATYFYRSPDGSGKVFADEVAQ